MALASDWVQPLSANGSLGIAAIRAAAAQTLLACCIAAVAVVCTGKATQALSAGHAGGDHVFSNLQQVRIYEYRALLPGSCF